MRLAVLHPLDHSLGVGKAVGDRDVERCPFQEIPFGQCTLNRDGHFLEAFQAFDRGYVHPFER